MRQTVDAKFYFDVAHLGYLLGVIDCLGIALPGLLHIIGTRQRIIITQHRQALCVTNRFSGLNANQDILRLGIISVNVVTISCSY